MNIRELNFDIIIIGAGGSGLMAAAQASKSDLTIACISKLYPMHSHTSAAQGGINAALGNIEKDDWRWHMYDTIRGSDWLGDQDAIAYMCKNAKSALLELEHMGMPFTRAENGKIYQRKYGGQSSDFGKGPPPPRACCVADRTGHSMLMTLYENSLKNKVKFYCEHFVLDLILDTEKNVKGVVAWDFNQGELLIFKAKITILATGGAGMMYKNTTSANSCTGDGNAYVLRAGLQLQDMEFIQFHPTGLYGSGLLITEAARGEGGFLVNAHGERFMERYAPNYKELASRDVISRAIANEIKSGNGGGDKKDHVFIDIRHLGEDVIKKKLPTVRETCLKFADCDPVKDLIPVVPAVHYIMGGIPTNINCQVIENLEGKDKIVTGLMAIGETASISIHGANRLGCNSLLDLVVFGKKSALYAVAEIKNNPEQYRENNLSNNIDKIINNFKEKFKRGHDYIPISETKEQLQEIMDQSSNVFKNGNDLLKAAGKVDNLNEFIPNIKITDTSLIWNQEMIELLELENLAIQARANLYSSIYRTESRGSHYREDYPKRDDKYWLYHSLFSIYNENKIYWSKRAVRTNNDFDIEPILPEEREY